MIYLIDDRIRRQEEYGWSLDRLNQYNDILSLVKNEGELKDNKEAILMEGNIVLFHESFMLSTDDNVVNTIETFKKALADMGSKIHVATFSGSKQSRFVSSDGNVCMLPADVFYEHLDVFFDKVRTRNVDFRYLAYGGNYMIEENLRNKIIAINDEDFGKEKIQATSNIFFASVSDPNLEVSAPFMAITVERDWDIQLGGINVNDTFLNNLVHNWFDGNKYDRIYIPLSFGAVLSDFLGLRLAMHIRMTDTPNKEVPIFIYGEGSINDLCSNECFDILKTNGCFLISGSHGSLIESYGTEPTIIKWDNELSKIHIKVPSNIGDNHSVANRWAISRWNSMFDWKGAPPVVLEDVLKDSLYLKYLESKSGAHQKFNKKHLASTSISGIEGKKIVYIDDEYDKGWDSLLSRLFSDSNAIFKCFKGFAKNINRDTLINDIKTFIDDNDADCYIVDLRLHDSDFEDNAYLSGHEIAEYIKNQNRGNQIVVFTASNKVWNLKKEINSIGALDYILKESPEMNLNRDGSKRLFDDFVRAVRLACNMSYLRDLVNKQNSCKDIYPDSSSLDSIIDLLQRDQNNENQDLIGAAFLAEMVFVEDFFKTQLGLSISRNGEGTSLEQCDLVRKDTSERFPMHGRIFIKREQQNGRAVVKEITDYEKAPIDIPNGFSVINESDVTIVACGMIVYLGMSIQHANTYIKYKNVRNQVAHQNKTKIEKIKVDDIIALYNNVVIPLIKLGANKV